MCGPAQNLRDAIRDESLHLTALGKPPEGFLGVQQVAVEADLEDAVAAFHQLGLEVETLLQFGRQTGGAWLVVSNDTVFDAHAGHISGLLSGMYSIV